MKRLILLAAILVPSLALAQAAAPKPAAAAAKPAPAAEVAKPVVAAESKPAAEPKKTRRNEDARQCLEQPNNNAIIKCAEAYL